MKKPYKILIFSLALLTAGCANYFSDTGYITKEIKKNNISIYFLDVGQGDSILVDNKMLIDCGNNDKGDVVVNFLNKNNISSLDYLVITHTDADHIGGCDYVLDNIAVKKVMMDGQIRDTKSYLDVIKRIDNEEKIITKENDRFGFDDIEFKVLSSNILSEDPNQNSIVLRMDYGKFSALFTGDCDRECERRLLDKNIDVDVLKVAHHCSRYGTGKEFLDKVTPDIAVIEVGDNTYGHPTGECLGNLKEKNIKIYRTDLNKDVNLVTDGVDFKIE